jgi:hypothetical protein
VDAILHAMFACRFLLLSTKGGFHMLGNARFGGEERLANFTGRGKTDYVDRA